MKHAAYWMMSALALCWTLTGCGQDQAPAAQEETAAAAAPATEAAAPAEPAAVSDEVAPVDAPAETAAPAEESALPAGDPAKVIAKVNGTDITDADIQKVLNMFMKQMGGRIPPDQVDTAIPRIRERIVEELIMRRVMLDAVAQAGVTLSDSEFEEIKAELAEELPPGTTFESYMAETGTTEAEMREQMAVRKMIIAQAESLAKPTDEAIQAFYEENKEGFAQGESVTASHILIKVEDSDDDAAKAAKRERIEGLRKQLQDGADFAELAKANSDCPSASAGGDLGSFGRGQMVPEFEDAAFTQPTGSVGEIVETQFGFHLIKVSERTEAKILPFEEVKPRISDILYSQQQQDAVRAFVDGLREKAAIERFDQPPSEETVLQLDVDEEEVIEAAPAAVEEVKEVVSEAVAVAEPVAEAAQEAAAEVATEAAAAADEAVAEVKEAAAEAAPATEEKAE